MTDPFITCHPAVNFVFMLYILGVSMFFLHPYFLLTALVAGLCYLTCLKGKKALIKASVRSVFMVFFMGGFNMLFSHAGSTILWYLKNGNPMTLESLIYGLASGLMLSVVMVWFLCFHEVMSSDKVMYLFGKTIPAFSLLFSMTLRFVPRFTEQIKKVSKAQQCIGRDVRSGSIKERIGYGMKILSITATWALENSVETADSMKSRGYGLRGRTNYSIYRLDKRDIRLLLVLSLAAAFVLWAIQGRWISVLYFPRFILSRGSGYMLLACIGHGLLCFLPLLLYGKEELKWRYLKSGI